MAAVLLVEDDPTIGRLVRSILSNDGHEVAWVRTAQDAERIVRRGSIELVLLDLGLPDKDGLELCRDIRQASPEAVIVMLTARRDEIDVIIGLETGADDYITKPFGAGELLARVRAHLRRASHVGSTQTTFVYGDLTVDLAGHRSFLGDVELTLRAKEFDLLARLASTAGEAVSRETLMSDVWGIDWFGSTKTLDVHMAAVRRHLLEAAARQPDLAAIPEIVTLRGYGYRLECTVKPGIDDPRR